MKDAMREAFMKSIRETPDDDAPRLVYADWLEENGGPSDLARAELIRVQCEAAKLDKDDPRIDALLKREAAILAGHQLEWTDLAFAEWLGHPKRKCRNPKGHEFCKIVAQGIRARCERDALLEGDERRAKLGAKLDRLGWRMEEEFNYTPDTRDAPLSTECDFIRGFNGSIDIDAWAVILFAEALLDYGVLERVFIEDESGADVADEALLRLAEVMPLLRLKELDSSAAATRSDTVRRFVTSPGLRSLEKLAVWFKFGRNGDAAVAALAKSPHLSNLVELEIEHSRTFSDKACLAILDSKHLPKLERCRLVNNLEMTISAAVRRRWEERFGKIG